jgi:hypothetical protein
MSKLNSFLSVILFCTVFTTFGQSKIAIGVEGGPNIIFLRGNEIMNQFYDPTIGFSGGATFQYNLGTIVSLHTGLSYERKGAAIRDVVLVDQTGNPTGSYTAHFNYNYLNLPILVRASFGEKTQFFVNAGPYIGYLINQMVVNSDTKKKYDNTKSNKKIDMGVSAGLGILIPFGEKLAFTLELRNNLGLYNVSALQFYPEGAIKTNSTNFLIGFTYRIGG